MLFLFFVRLIITFSDNSVFINSNQNYFIIKYQTGAIPQMVILSSQLVKFQLKMK
jgi:hypothetical protein